MRIGKIDWGIVLAFVLLFLGVTSVFIPYFKLDGILYGDYVIKIGDYNELGDFVGGITAPFLSMSAFLLLYLTYKSQKAELFETRKTLTEQNATLKKDQFEKTFFSLLNLHHEIISAMDFDSSLDVEMYEEGADKRVIVKGRDCFRIFFSIFLKKYRNWEAEHKKTPGDKVKFVPEIEKEIIQAAFADFYVEHEVDFGHYYRNVETIVQFVDSSAISDKEFYINLLRSQLSTYETILLFYSCLWGDEYSFRKLMGKYSLLKNINYHHLNNPQDVELVEKKLYT